MLTLDAPITWRSLARIGLGFAGEYALLALIEDAPAALKIATVVCAVAGLFVLESESWLRRRDKHGFGSAVVIVTAIYMSFVWYAVNHVLTLRAEEAKIRAFYAEGSALLRRDVPAETDSPLAFDPLQIHKLQQDSEAWETKVSEWLEKNVGPSARIRF